MEFHKWFFSRGIYHFKYIILREWDPINKIFKIESKPKEACLKGEWNDQEQGYRVGNILFNIERDLRRKIIPYLENQCVLQCYIFDDSIRVWYYESNSQKNGNGACFHKYGFYILEENLSGTIPKIRFKNMSREVCKWDLLKGPVKLRDPIKQEPKMPKIDQIKKYLENYFGTCKKNQCSNYGNVEVQKVFKKTGKYKKCLDLETNKLFIRQVLFDESGKMIEPSTIDEIEEKTNIVCEESSYNQNDRTIEKKNVYYRLITENDHEKEYLKQFFKINCGKIRIK